MKTEWLEIMRQIPFVDAHCHVMPQAIGNYASGNRPFSGKSLLAELLLGYGSVLCFLTAGMQWDEINKIRDGTYSDELCKKSILQYLPFVENTLPVSYCRRGLSLLAGESIEINDAAWDDLENLLRSCGSDYDHMLEAMHRQNISKAILNMWTGWTSSYYGKYHEMLSESDQKKDEAIYTTIATFDSYAIEPFTEATREYARLLHEDAESFTGYDNLIETLADFFVTQHKVKGFKISEAYFRSLDYQPVQKTEAKKCFKENPSAQERNTLSNYVTWKILEQARRLKVPVQIHTGELWGDCHTQRGNPIFLESVFRAFPDVKFDLLHCGYPFMAETGILATNYNNIYINMAYMPLRSLRQFREWLDLYCGILSSNRILLGTDVFNVECMTGCIDAIREQCAVLAEDMNRTRLSSERAIRVLFERLFHGNAEELYKI